MGDTTPSPQPRPPDSTPLPAPACADGPLPPWEKVLWRRQPYPDNYVPPSYLSELAQLPQRPRPALLPLIVATFPVAQHLAVIALFLGVFYAMLVGDLQPAEVGWGCAVIGLAAYALYRFGWGGGAAAPGAPFIPAASALRPLVLPPLLLSLLSPVLGTLTSATTSDSIWPLAGGLFFVHLLLADFTTGPDARRRALLRRARRRRNSNVGSRDAPVEEKSLTSSLSLTSALSASVVLASRLPTTAHVFSLVMLAAGLFAGWPTLAKAVRESGKPFSAALTASMVWLAITLLPPAHAGGSGRHLPPLPVVGALPLPSGATLIFLVVLLIVNVGGPLLLWWGWRFKRRREGSWDVAKVRVRRRL